MFNWSIADMKNMCFHIGIQLFGSETRRSVLSRESWLKRQHDLAEVRLGAYEKKNTTYEHVRTRKRFAENLVRPKIFTLSQIWIILLL